MVLVVRTLYLFYLIYCNELRSKIQFECNVMKLFNKSIFNPYWVVGFVDGEGCFSVGVFKNKTLR